MSRSSFLKIPALLLCTLVYFLPGSLQAGDLYVTGSGYFNGEKKARIAAFYYKNGVATVLNETGGDARAEGIFVSGSDVYIAGGFKKDYSVNTWRAVYWKNSEPVFLTDAGGDAYATSVYVSRGDVYVAGRFLDESTGMDRAVYWKNGHMVPLTSGKHNAFASDILVSGSEVYVAGSVTYGASARAVVWKEGEPGYLSDGTHYALVNDIEIRGSDLYAAVVSGWSGDEATRTFYWKNGRPVELQGFRGVTSAMHLDIRNGDVYALGTDGGSMVCWKNGSAEIVAVPGTWRRIAGVYASRSEVYAAGTAEYGEAGVWRNGAYEAFPGDERFFVKEIGSFFVAE